MILDIKIVCLPQNCNYSSYSGRCVNISCFSSKMLAGYPVWTLVYQSYFFSEDGIAGKDCLLPDNPNGCNLPESCPQIIRQVILGELS